MALHQMYHSQIRKSIPIADYPSLEEAREKYGISEERKPTAVDVDDLNEVGYNIINTTGRRNYSRLKSEVMTWDDIKYLNQVRCTYLSSKGFYIYKMLDNDTHDIIVYRANSNYAKKQQQLIRKLYRSRAYDTTVSVSRLIEDYRNASINDSKLSRDGQRQSGINVNVDVEALRRERNDNRGRITEDDSNDNLSKRASKVVTYDADNLVNDGDVIPPSKRFSDDVDFRFSQVFMEGITLISLLLMHLNIIKC